MKAMQWNSGERMSKEYALDVIDGIKQFYRRLYYQPKMKPFNTKEVFEASIEELNGLKEMIKSSVRESSEQKNKERNNIGEMVNQNTEDKYYKRYKQVCYRYLFVKSLLAFLLGCLVSFLLRLA